MTFCRSGVQKRCRIENGTRQSDTSRTVGSNVGCEGGSCYRQPRCLFDDCQVLGAFMQASSKAESLGCTSAFWIAQLYARTLPLMLELQVF